MCLFAYLVVSLCRQDERNPSPALDIKDPQIWFHINNDSTSRNAAQVSLSYSIVYLFQSAQPLENLFYRRTYYSQTSYQYFWFGMCSLYCFVLLCLVCVSIRCIPACYMELRRLLAWNFYTSIDRENEPYD